MGGGEGRTGRNERRRRDGGEGEGEGDSTACNSQHNLHVEEK